MIRREFAARIAAAFPGLTRMLRGEPAPVPQRGSLNLPVRVEAISDGPSFWIINAKGPESEAIRGDGFFGLTGRADKFKNGMGVGGFAAGAESAGVDGRSEDGLGVYGLGKTGVRGTTSNRQGLGVEGRYVAAAGTYTMFGPAREFAPITHGKLGTPQNGVEGLSDVLNGKGIAGRAEMGDGAVAVYGQSTKGLAGYFRGRVTIEDSLLVKKIDVNEFSAAKKLFRIDHPLEPASRTLAHASIESDSLKNLYDGVATLDDTGTAWITLPRWFDALNTDVRYQLTCIGSHAPVYIAREVEANRFQIAGGRPSTKVSWQVTGVRHDVYARAHPLLTEEDKPPADQGRYLNPLEYGLSQTAAIGYRHVPAIERCDDANCRDLDETDVTT